MTGIKAVRAVETTKLPREEWLAQRRKGIGSSDIAAIAGFNPWSSPIQVYLNKTGRGEDMEMNERMQWGIHLEPVVADAYAEKTSRKVSRVNAILQHADSPICLANIDRMAGPLNGEKNGVLEIKCTSYAKPWAGGADAPDMYYCQLIWQLGITGLNWGQFAVLLNGNELIIPNQVSADQKVFDGLRTIAERFWHDHVVKDVPPNPSCAGDYDGVKALYGDVQEKTCVLPETLAPLIAKRKELSEMSKSLEDQRKEIDAQVLFAMKENKWGTCGATKVTRVCSSKTSLDTKRIQVEEPAVYKKYLKSFEVQYPLYSEAKQKC